MAKKTLRSKILSNMLIVTVSCIAVMSAAFIVALERIDDYATESANSIGNEAATVSAQTMETQLETNLVKFAENTAVIIEEQLIRVENVSLLLAETVTTIYSHSSTYKARALPIITDGQSADAGETYIHMMPAVTYTRVKNEAELVSNCADVLRYLSKLPTQTVSYWVVGESGYIIAMDNSPAPVQNYTATQRSWYELAKQSEQVSWTDIYVDNRGRGLIMSCAAPFYDVFSGKKSFKGVSGCDVSIAKFEEIISAANIWKNNAYVFLLDKNGQKLFSSDGTGIRASATEGIKVENYASNPNYAGFSGRMTKGETGFLRIPNQEGKEDYVAWHPLRRFAGRLGWSVGIYFNGNEISGQMGQLKLNMDESAKTAQRKTDYTTAGVLIVIIAIALFITALAVILVFRFSERVTRPIIELGDAAMRLGGGNLNVSAEVTTDTEELDRLAIAFNSMTSNIKAYIKNFANVTADIRRFNSELYVARAIQNTMLPNKFPEQTGEKRFDIYAFTKNTEEISGDFYDFFMIDKKRLIFIIGDVSLNGIPAALFMSETKTLLRSWLCNGSQLDAVFAELNTRLREHNEAGAVVSVWAGLLELESGKLQFVNAGHTSPFIGTDKNPVLLEADSCPGLGLDDGAVYKRMQINIQKGDTLFLYSRGLLELLNSNGERYKIERISGILNEKSSSSMKELLELVKTDIANFIGSNKQESDITLFALKLN
ncbi:MAG: SpoIIE family protein phosphatase [Spirochaetaceae bacterium]|jgi:sigma-B regulation protein RsbU (phosphoserine phosphatase)|nr:SpoIIE family protein phosphatase [Spirochaetaceae bacterium]